MYLLSSCGFVFGDDHIKIMFSPAFVNQHVGVKHVPKHANVVAVRTTTPASREKNSRSGGRETTQQTHEHPRSSLLGWVFFFFYPGLMPAMLDVGVQSFPPASRLRPQFLPVAHCVAACSDYLHRQRASETLPSKTLITPDALHSLADDVPPECSDRSGRPPADDRIGSEWENKNGNISLRSV